MSAPLVPPECRDLLDAVRDLRVSVFRGQGVADLAAHLRVVFAHADRLDPRPLPVLRTRIPALRRPRPALTPTQPQTRLDAIR